MIDGNSPLQITIDPKFQLFYSLPFFWLLGDYYAFILRIPHLSILEDLFEKLARIPKYIGNVLTEVPSSKIDKSIFK